MERLITMPWTHFESAREPISPPVTYATLGRFVDSDPLARAALHSGATQAALIKLLLEDRERLLKDMESLLKLQPPPPIIIQNPGNIAIQGLGNPTS